MKTALITGAGPAGSTAAYELPVKTDIIPIVAEADKQVGGLSKTIDHQGNKIDKVEEFQQTQLVVGLQIDLARWLEDVLGRIVEQPQDKLIELLPQFWKPPPEANARSA